MIYQPRRFCMILLQWKHRILCDVVDFFDLFPAVPEVKVTPRIQSRRPGKDASMFCHVIGEPFPKVSLQHLMYECVKLDQ
jgi:hypothetical protein